jgi:formate hydrogenlyase subunit 6/NADH:ubiquinone oxidoreductase subunit I
MMIVPTSQNRIAVLLKDSQNQNQSITSLQNTFDALERTDWIPSEDGQCQPRHAFEEIVWARHCVECEACGYLSLLQV